jgi:hypothetical protein
MIVGSYWVNGNPLMENFTLPLRFFIIDDSTTLSDLFIDPLFFAGLGWEKLRGFLDKKR